MASIIPQRMTATHEGELVVFLIGMRINSLWKVHKWFPVARAMGRMLDELYQRPELGFLGAESWLGRTILVVQYWKSMDALMSYAHSKDLQHLPAWREFNKKVGSNGEVGIWHETYHVQPGGAETVYANMPPFLLGKFSGLTEARGARQSARGRLAYGQKPAAGGPQPPAPAPNSGDSSSNPSHLAPNSGEVAFHPSHLAPNSGDSSSNPSHLAPNSGEAAFHPSHPTPAPGDHALLG
jgi:hypothetical protein